MYTVARTNHLPTEIFAVQLTILLVAHHNYLYCLQVMYRFAPGTDSVVSSTFNINVNTGVIILSLSLDFENTERYDFYVEARDLSAASLTSNVSVV